MRALGLRRRLDQRRADVRALRRTASASPTSAASSRQLSHLPRYVDAGRARRRLRRSGGRGARRPRRPRLDLVGEPALEVGARRRRRRSDRRARAQTRSISSAWPGPRPSSGSRHQMPSSSPWRRSTSWQPAMQPGNRCATSKKALLQSVTRLSSASRSRRRRRRLCDARAWMRSSSSTALRVHTRPVAEQAAADAHRHRLAVAHRRRTASRRSSTMWSSLPV